MSKIAGNPYPGSRAFTQADQAFLFGRDPDTAMVADLWTANRLTIVSGPVASGKTSLLHAGVYPLMLARPARPLPAGNLFHGMTFPVPALPEHNPFTLALLRSWSPDDVPTRLAGLTVSDFVARLTRGRGDVAYAAIDQLDDLMLGDLPGPWAAWRQQFLTELTQALADHPRLHLLLVTRGSALDLLTSAVGRGAQHAITGLTPRDAIEAVTRPALEAGRPFTGNAARDLIYDLCGAPESRTAENRAAESVAPEDADPAADSYVEPELLQVACHRLWEELPADVTEISDWAVREFSDTDTALAARCEHVISEVAALHGMSSRDLRSRLANSVGTGGGPGPRGSGLRGTGEDALAAADLPAPVLRDLLDRHLLTSEISGSKRYYRLLAPRLAEPLRIASPERSAPPAPATYLYAAELDLARGELGLAQAHGKRARDLIPDSALREASGLRERAQAESLLGNVAYRRGDPGAALPYYRQAAEFVQASGDIRGGAYQLAAAGIAASQLQQATDEPAGAVSELRAAVEREPNDLGLQTQLALALWRSSGDGQAAVGILNWVLSMDSGHPGARRARGEILADLGDAPGAMLDLDHVAAGHPASRAARGLALAELGDHTAAAEEVNGALADARRSGPVLLYAARASELAGDKVSARFRAQEALDAEDPPLFRAHRQIARELAGQRRGFADSYPRSS